MPAPEDLFPGFSRPPTSPIRDMAWKQRGEADAFGQQERCVVRLQSAERYPPADIEDNGYRLCPVCQGDGVSGYDARERDIPCPHCTGGVIL